MRIVNGEFAGICLDSKEVHQKRSRITSLVLTAMPYEESRYASRVEYECTVLNESARRMNLSDCHNPKLLTAIADNLKDGGVTQPGCVPEKYVNVFGKEDGGGPSKGCK